MPIFVDRDGIHCTADAEEDGQELAPLTAVDLAALVHDMLAARGQNPTMGPRPGVAVHAATQLLAAFGIDDSGQQP